MKWLANLRMVYKLGLLLAIAVVTVVVLVLTGYFGLREANRELELMYSERLVPMDMVNEAGFAMRRVDSATLELLLNREEAKKSGYEAILNEQYGKVNDMLTQIAAMNLDPRVNSGVQAIQQPQAQHRESLQQIIGLARQNKYAEAQTVYATRFDPVTVKMVKDLQGLNELFDQLAAENLRHTRAEFVQAIWIDSIIALACLLLLLAGGFAVTRAITAPVSAMVVLCERFAAGDFRLQEKQPERHDEIGRLAGAMEQMREKLRDLMKQVANSAEQLAAASEQLTASAEQSAQAATQIAVSITDVAKGADEQLTATADTSAVVEQMSAGAEEMAASAAQVAAQSAEVGAKAAAGGESVEKAVGQMGQIEKTSQLVAESINTLGEQSQEIGQIVDTIAGIAGQTNLLALNAAIEAARAGEHGRGFAVVAEEVRKLAEQSQEAAKQIAQLIGNIQTDTEQAVANMTAGGREVKAGIEAVGVMGQTFHEIVNLVGQANEKIEGLSQAAQQIAVGSQNIVADVQRIDALSKDAASNSQTVSAATEEQSASMQQIAASSQSLAHLAQDLQTAVSRFQI
ncbi:MAG: HAMP domain-containing methyl-accepting chemotaxis protein [Sporomusaceae bacterium]|nr:HAMP domain-containing methyl-accepting chemotaxis protein [Sporomusaceae bacterium]